MSEKIFVNGMIIKPRHERTPDYVLANISFKVEDMVAFLQQHQDGGWVNVQVMKSQQGKDYAALDTWKPQQQQQQAPQQQNTPPPPFPDEGEQDSIPFG